MPNNNNNKQNSSPFGRRSSGSPFGSRSNNKLALTYVPTHQNVVMFSLNGLGDPFYRLLGYPMDPEMGNLVTLARTLEQGGEKVDALRDMLDRVWMGYGLDGAMLVYPQDESLVEMVNSAAPMPPRVLTNNKADDDKEDKDDDDEADDESPTPVPDTELIQMTRAIDTALTLNVLARARRQVLIAHAPLVFGYSYLARSLVVTDPRLVELAQATGALPVG